MEEDEEIARAIRRDPRWPIRVLLLLALLVILGTVGLASLSKLRLGERAAHGFSTITEVPPPSGDRPTPP